MLLPNKIIQLVDNAALHPEPAHSLSQGDRQGVSFPVRSFDLHVVYVMALRPSLSLSDYLSVTSRVLYQND